MQSFEQETEYLLKRTAGLTLHNAVIWTLAILVSNENAVIWTGDRVLRIFQDKFQITGISLMSFLLHIALNSMFIFLLNAFCSTQLVSVYTCVALKQMYRILFFMGCLNKYFNLFRLECCFWTTVFEIISLTEVFVIMLTEHSHTLVNFEMATGWDYLTRVDWTFWFYTSTVNYWFCQKHNLLYTAEDFQKQPEYTSKCFPWSTVDSSVGSIWPSS